MTRRDAPRDPLLDATIERALEPYRALLTAEQLELFRDLLGEGLAADPLASKLLRAARPAPQVEKSDEVRRDAGPDGAGEHETAGTAGRRR